MVRTPAPRPYDLPAARRIWLRAQALDRFEPFGAGPAATAAATAHLGYVQIDTIHVIERSHHHILWTRIPGYRRADLAQAQSVDRSVFEYWTHALAYVATPDLPHFLRDMAQRRASLGPWFGSIDPAALTPLLARIRREGPLSIRDIDDGVRVAKTHPWASAKPAKRVLEYGFFAGRLTVSARAGMVKTYELIDRHFGWPPRPRAPTPAQSLDWRLDRALRSQGLVSLDSICFGQAALKPAMAALIAARAARGRLLPATLEGEPGYWIAPQDAEPPEGAALVHLLSPFDPLAIQRPRLARFFGHDHRFEAYVPAARRILGYFALPVLVDDRIAAAIDLKADRVARRLEIRQWTWLDGPRDGDKARIEAALDRFEAFQFDP